MSLPIHSQAAPRPQDLHPMLGALSLRRGRVHELCGPSRLRLAAEIMGKGQGPVVWVRPAWVAERLNAAGLQPLADPARLILVHSDREEELLWAAEEALRSGAAPLVVAELLTPPRLTPIRRLHLAAEAGAGAAARDGGAAPLGLVLLPGLGGAEGVESRWHMAPLASRSLLWSDAASWTLTRLRARLLPPARWSVERINGQPEALFPQSLDDLPVPTP
jgi:protein ImuA